MLVTDGLDLSRLAEDRKVKGAAGEGFWPRRYAPTLRMACRECQALTLWWQTSSQRLTLHPGHIYLSLPLSFRGWWKWRWGLLWLLLPPLHALRSPQWNVESSLTSPSDLDPQHQTYFPLQIPEPVLGQENGREIVCWRNNLSNKRVRALMLTTQLMGWWGTRWQCHNDTDWVSWVRIPTPPYLSFWMSDTVYSADHVWISPGTLLFSTLCTCVCASVYSCACTCVKLWLRWMLGKCTIKTVYLSKRCRLHRYYLYFLIHTDKVMNCKKKEK